MAEQKNLTAPNVAAQETPKTCGLIIRLEKDALWSKRSGNDPVLGYFDHIKFQPVNNWLDFSPRTTAVEFHNNGRETLEDTINESLLSMYPIKLLFPEQLVMDELRQKVGLSYTSWHGDISALLEQNPYLTVLLVNLTDEFKGEIPRDPCGEQLKRFADVIRQGEFLFPDESGKPVPYNQDWAKEANFCIMPSLGYSDYGIILAEKNWRFAPVLIEFLHRAVYVKPNSLESVPILSTDYVIPAYHSTNRTDINKEGRDSGIQLSMRIHLRPGITMLDLRQAVGDGIDIYQLSGSSDCILETTNDAAFFRLLRVSASGSIGDDSIEGKIRTLIVNTEVSFRCPVSNTVMPHNDQTVEIKASDQIRTQIKNLREVLKSYWVLLRDENRHMRQFNSMWNWVTTIDNICRGPHNRSLQQIMRPWLDAFTDCLRRCVEQTATLAGENPRDEDDLRLWLEYVDNMMEAFIVEAGSLLADLSRSDCFFMESERYNHASVSSATSLLIAYNRWQNQFVEDVLGEDPDNQCQYAFLVRSGGCDSTTTNNIFYSLEPEVVTEPIHNREILKESMPLITQMSEMSLFDCGGTVLRMTHECMHYCGERQRKKRAMYIIQFAARNFGEQLACRLFSKESYPQRITNNLREKFFLDDENLAKAISAAWMHGLKEFRMHIAGWLETELTRYYEEDCTRWNEQNYMCDSLRQWMLNKLTSIFTPFCFNEKHRYSYSDLAEFLRSEQRKITREFYHSCDAEIRKKNEKITCLALDRRQVDAYLRGEKDSGSLMQSIVWTLNQLLITPAYGVEFVDMHNDYSGNELFNTLGMVVFDCFSECFADVEACKRLHVSLVDYLLGFVFEDWNIQNAIPLDAPYLFRIPAVLRVCFRTALDEQGISLSEDTANDIRDAVECLVKRGMPEQRKNAEQLIGRTNELLKRYHALMWIAEPLEDYMRACVEYYNEHSHPNMQKYQIAFQRIRLLDSRNVDNVAQLFTNLITIGEVNGVGS